MELLKEEQSWSDSLTTLIRDYFPEKIGQNLVYDSRACGDPRPCSDLNVIVAARARAFKEYASFPRRILRIVERSEAGSFRCRR
jgi:hypothetical protein